MKVLSSLNVDSGVRKRVTTCRLTRDFEFFAIQLTCRAIRNLIFHSAQPSDQEVFANFTWWVNPGHTKP